MYMKMQLLKIDYLLCFVLVCTEPQRVFKYMEYLKSLFYTQTKKIRPIFMVLYLLIQFRCLSKKYTKCLSNVRHTKVGNYFIISYYLEELLNLK